MNRLIHLSVIIPCLNAEATLAVQLEALASQKFSHVWEVIVVDNGSTDHSIAIAESYRARFPAFKTVIAVQRKGAAHARNVGVSEARSEKIAFCDADDEVAPDWVRQMVEGLETHDVVYGRFRFDKFNDPVVAERANKSWENGLITVRFLPGGGSGNLGVRRDVHQAIGGFDESLVRSEDADYYWRLQLEGFAMHFIPQAIVQVRRERINPTLSFLYCRRRDTVASNYWSYKRYKNLGMLAPPPLKPSLSAWMTLIKRLVFFKIRRRRHLKSWLRQFMHQSGEVVGQLKGRLLTPCKPYQPGNIALAMKRKPLQRSTQQLKSD